MKRKDFERLVTSVKQAGAIRRGSLKPWRMTDFDPDDVRATRQKLGKSQEQFCPDDRRQCGNAAELGAGTSAARRSGPRALAGRGEKPCRRGGSSGP